MTSWLQAGSNQEELLRSFQQAGASAEPAIEAQTLFLAINELYGVLLGAEIDRLEALIRLEFPDIKHVDIEPDGIHLSNWQSWRRLTAKGATPTPPVDDAGG